jgi:hypothetical protein
MEENDGEEVEDDGMAGDERSRGESRVVEGEVTVGGVSKVGMTATFLHTRPTTVSHCTLCCIRR